MELGGKTRIEAGMANREAEAVGAPGGNVSFYRTTERYQPCVLPTCAAVSGSIKYTEET